MIEDRVVALVFQVVSLWRKVLSQGNGSGKIKTPKHWGSLRKSTYVIDATEKVKIIQFATNDLHDILP